jgi:cell division protein FtsI (penicillin-binding protein 3)
MSRWRHYTLLVGFCALALGLGVRIVYLAAAESDFLIDQGDNRSIRTVSIPAYRGVVYDRFGEPLALSTPAAAVWTDPTRETLSEEDIGPLAAVLDLDSGKLSGSLHNASSREFVYLKRRVPWSDAQRVKALGLKGVHFEAEYQRYYPAGETAAHVVGLTDIDDRGLEGIELSFDQRLRGEPGEKQVLLDLRGQTIKNLQFRQPPRYGEDLTLAIDLRLQFLAYRELKAAVESHRAKSGSLVMLDVSSGEILALVNQPSYNPNDRRDRPAAGMRNRAITDMFEPGSTIKPFTVLAALESGEYTGQSTFDTSPGYVRIGRKVIGGKDRGVITLETALKKSSQVAITKLALELDERAVYDTLVRAGVSEYAGTGMPGEVAGSMSDLGLQYELNRATLAYGYGLAVTPLQLASAYLTLATGGIRLPISILRQDQPPSGTRVFQEELVRDVVSMMEGVTDDNGTAPRARVDGFRVAGKTGTVRKFERDGYSDEKHVGWFAGIVPADQPRLVTVVMINEPKSMDTGGGDTAAPVYGRVMARALRLLGVSPDEVSAD